MLAAIISREVPLILIFLGLPLWALFDARSHGASWMRIGASGVALLFKYPIGLIATIVTFVLARRQNPRLNP